MTCHWTISKDVSASRNTRRISNSISVYSISNSFSRSLSGDEYWQALKKHLQPYPPIKKRHLRPGVTYRTIPARLMSVVTVHQCNIMMSKRRSRIRIIVGTSHLVLAFAFSETNMSFVVISFCYSFCLLFAENGACPCHFMLLLGSFNLYSVLAFTHPAQSPTCDPYAPFSPVHRR